MKKFLFLFFLIFSLQNSSAQDYYSRNWNVDIQHYTFSLLLSNQSDTIVGTTKIRVLFKGDVSELDLDLAGINDEGKGMKVSSVRLGIGELKFDHSKDKLKIDLNRVYHEKESIEIDVNYSGVPADGLIIANNKFGDRTFFGDNWPDRAHQWLPCVDHPSDKASVDFIVTAPEYYSVIANGIKKEESALQNGLKQTHWSEKVDLATKVMVIGVARFAIEFVQNYHGISVESWVYPQNRKEGFADYSMATGPLILFDQLIGSYPYQKLANVQSKTRYGGMENASNIFYFENSVTGNKTIEALLAHEIAHQWFGNSASEKDWHHIWLSEGFATYFATWYMGWMHGKDEFNKRMTEAREQVIKYYLENPAPIVNTAIHDYTKLLNPNSYQKGAWVLHMLSEEIGNEDFMDGVRSYYLKYENGNVLTEDLEREFEIVSGKDLNQFFKQWIYTPGQPELMVNWKFDAGKKQLRIKVTQKQDQLFIFPLEVNVQSGSTQKIFKFKIEKREMEFMVESDQQPEIIVLDPKVKLLFHGEITGNR